MINQLRLIDFFVHKSKTFDFTTGLTGIIGPNESGKSLVMEGIRYALFGTAALRYGAAEVHVEMDFSVKGVSHTVVRRCGNATLDDAVVGTRAVNAAIIKLLGYDLSVFDVANACNQGQVEALSNMKPTERKAMVDKTVGLDTLDGLIKFCGERGNALKNQAVGFERGLVSPPPPAQYLGRSVAELKPLVAAAEADTKEMHTLQGFSFASEGQKGQPGLADLIKSAQADLTEYNQLTGYLAKAPTQPGAPGPCEVTESVSSLEKYQHAREQILETRRVLTNHGLTAELMSATGLDLLTDQWAAYDLWQERKRLLAMGHLCCPSCNHTWPVAGAVPEAVETTQPAQSKGWIETQRGRQGNAAKIAGIVLPDVPEDLSGQLKILRAYEASLAVYLAASDAYESYHSSIGAKRARHASLQGAGAKVLALQEETRLHEMFVLYQSQTSKRERLTTLVADQSVRAALAEEYILAQTAERLQAEYEAKLSAYEAAVAEHTRLVAESKKYLDARTAILGLKTKVKSFLLPSLNRVASHLLNQMTGGVRNDIEVNEDFEIKIDGQPVDVLSGSGKAVANLSIRIALGQILTNRMFSVFLADEVDGSMDTERADYTADALRRLTGLISQVILITHKRPEVDNLVELKK